MYIEWQYAAKQQQQRRPTHLDGVKLPLFVHQSLRHFFQLVDLFRQQNVSFPHYHAEGVTDYEISMTILGLNSIDLVFGQRPW